MDDFMTLFAFVCLFILAIYVGMTIMDKFEENRPEEYDRSHML